MKELIKVKAYRWSTLYTIDGNGSRIVPMIYDPHFQHYIIYSNVKIAGLYSMK